MIVIVFGQGDEQPDDVLKPGIGGTTFKVTFKENWLSDNQIEEHTCVYCGCITTQPDSECYKNPNK